MPLDLSRLHGQIEEMANHLLDNRADFLSRLEFTISLARQRTSGTQLLVLKDRIESHRGRYTWLVPNIEEPLDAAYPPPFRPNDFVVVAVDGSQIEVERDAPAPCYLLNTGRVTLRYGSTPEAHLESIPTLHFGDDRMVLRDPDSNLREQQIDGVILGALRAIDEVRTLADLVSNIPFDLPVVAILDGTLLLWGLAGQGYPAFVRQHLLTEYTRALDILNGLAQQRPLAVASYISFPRTYETVNTLRIAICPYPEPDCDLHCRGTEPLQRGCDPVARVRDRDLFGALLRPGWRSSLLASRSSIVFQNYGPHEIHFFYIHAGNEVARVEIPIWSAGSIDLLHSVLWDQIQLGAGYPLALAEAHERAVVTSHDRDLFWQIVQATVDKGRLAPRASEKSLAKKRRWL